jgi:FkbM family methyltransferase
VSHDDFEIDLRSLAFIVVDEAYGTDYEGTIVLDIGAHKGYFAAYAVRHGARRVVAYEPESANLEALERTAAAYRDDAAWTLRHAAVDATAGRAELHIMGASWGHTLHPPEEFTPYEVGLEAVDVVALTQALTEIGEGPGRVVVKMNIEGAECSAILGSAPGIWDGVSEVFVETHPWAACDAASLAAHLSASGLIRLESAHPAVLRMRR